MADIEDGYFEYDENGLVKFLSQPNITRDMLLELRDFVETAKFQELTKEEVLQKADDLSPALTFIKQFIIPKDQANFYAFLTLLITILSLLLDKMENKPATTNNYTTNVYVTDSNKQTFSQRMAKLPDLRKNTNQTLPKKKRKGRK